MRYRLTASLTTAAATALTGAMLAPASATPQGTALAPVPDGWCATASPAPCVVSAYRGSTALTDGGAYDINPSPTSRDGAHSASFQFSQPGAGVTDPNAHTPGATFASLPDSDIGQRFTVTLEVDFNPRETDEYGKNVTVTKVDNGDGTWNVTWTGDAVEQGINDECDVTGAAWTCPQTAGKHITTFFGEVSDFQQWNDSSQWVDFNGMNTATNVEEVVVPPTVSGDPLVISAQMANSQFLDDSGSSPFEGFYDVLIPNQFLVDMGIDDPSTLDPDGISAAIGSGSVTVTPGPTATEVDVTGITFSTLATPGHLMHAIAAAQPKVKQRQLKIKKGTITPTRPKVTKGKRHPSSVKLIFTEAHPRGSHLKHYQARCRASGLTTRTATAKRSPIVVRRLSHSAYKCQVRAKAKAGYGRWSHKHRVRA